MSRGITASTSRCLRADSSSRSIGSPRRRRLRGCQSACSARAPAVVRRSLRRRSGHGASRGGRPDLAGAALARVEAPTLLLVGGRDDVVIELNEQARAQMRGDVRLELIPGATHLFEERGALEQVAAAAREWFLLHLRAPSSDRVT